ncbi:Protein BEX4 [Galemys pyrenaicus]|uniref:Protein BEX4 n=1 Tax=Galemys pyrenaicus TaxID=202257 RepID=A0A8J5ZNX4_GALPY|nr:Protein BEX4 [Galemys pyrenaicus]
MGGQQKLAGLSWGEGRTPGGPHRLQTPVVAPAPPLSRGAANGCPGGDGGGWGRGRETRVAAAWRHGAVRGRVVLSSAAAAWSPPPGPLQVPVSRRRARGENREEEETARIGPGAMASKEEQVLKNRNMESARQEKEEGEQPLVRNGEEAQQVGGGEGQKHGGKRGLIRRFVPSFRWVIPNKHADHNDVGDDVDKFVGQMVEVKRKTKEQQMRHYMRFQTPEPDNHYDFCLIP